MSNTDATNKSLTAWEKAFMDSFKNTHGQYEISDKDILAFLTGNTDKYFEGYTQLADARNLWADAIVYARRST